MAKIKANTVVVKYGGNAISDLKSVNFTLKQNFDDDKVKSDGDGPHHAPTYVEFTGSFVMARSFGSYGTVRTNQLAGSKADVSIFVGATKLVGAVCLIESSSVSAPVEGKVNVTVGFRSVAAVSNS